MHPLYGFLRFVVSRGESRVIPPPVPAQEAKLVAAYRELPSARDNDGLVPTNSQVWGELIHATVADHQLVVAKTDPEAGHKGMTAFIVEREWPGVTTRETENKLGVWAGSTGELFFENVEVPAENRLGDEGQGFEVAMHSLDHGRFTVAAGAQVEQHWALAGSHAWYDFTVRLAEDPSWLRRFAGRVETGKASVTDPAMAM